LLDELKDPNALARLLQERAVQLVVIALLIALALDSALILTRALGGSEASPPPAAAQTPAPPHPGGNPTLRLATIVNAHLFGLAGVSAAGDAPPTTAALVLAGVLADRDPARGQAIIGEKAASAKLYAVGAAIPGGAHLRSVYSDRVLIERNGVLESLLLPHTPLKAAPPGPAPAPLLRTAAAGARDNATLLAGIMRVQAVFNQGKLDGYRIFPGNSRGTGAFQEMGLRAGDMILAVNGTALDDPARAMEVLQTLSSSGSATVTVSRDGTSQEIALNLATLNSIAEGTDAASSPPGAGAAPAAAPGQRMRFGAPAASGEAAAETAAPAPPAAAAAGAPASPPAAPDEAASTNTNAERQR
jgi:general secretion pathway protein C